MKDLFRFFRLPGREKIIVAKVFCTVLRVRLCLWFFPKRSVRRWLPTVENDHINGKAVDWFEVRRMVERVEHCSRYIPKATCLTQALSAFLLLRNAGQLSNVKIGVEKDQAGRLAAHAWVEVEGKIVLGRVPRLDRFTVLGSATMTI